MTTEEKISQLEARIAVLEQQVACKAPALKPCDRAVLERVLPAIKGRIGSESFRTSELWQRIPVMSQLTTLNAHQLGMLFSRATEVDVNGLHIQRIKTAGGALLWALCVSPPSPPSSV